MIPGEVRPKADRQLVSYNQRAPKMLNWVLYCRTGIARVLAVILAAATAFYLEERYGVARYWAWGSALVVYLIVPVLWGLITFRRGQRSSATCSDTQL